MRLIDADALVREICRDQCERKYEDCDGMCQMVAYAENAPTVVTDTNVLGKWISIKDRLPENHSCCLVSDGSGITFGFYRDGAWEGIPKGIDVRWWMPLPEPPKEVKE